MRNLVVGDFHIPFENQESNDKFLEHLKELRPDRIILGGDIIDCWEISRFRKNPIWGDTIQNELSFAQELFKKIRRICPKIQIDYIEANHEFRFKLNIMEGNPELYFMFEGGLIGEKGLDLTKYNITYHPVREGLAKFSHNFIEVEGWLVGHFDKSVKNGGYTARALRDEFGMPIIQFHTHKIGSSYRTYHNGIKGAHEVGCMCDINKAFINNPDWQNGYGILEDGKFYQIVL